jgi:hypothetical protein
MAVTGVVEQAASRGVTGRFRETFTYTRSFLVRVDDPRTSTVEISQAPGVTYLQPHPDDLTCIALEFDCQAVDESGLFYRVGVKYYVPPVEQQEQPNNMGLPPDQWAASASITTGPATVDGRGRPIVNSAGDPIPELEMDQAEFRWTLTRCVPDMSWGPVAATATNAVNSGAWANGGKGEWKCHFQNASKRTENNGQAIVTYWECVFDFVYRAGGWALKPLDVGLNEKKGGKKKPIRVAGQVATTPVALRYGVGDPDGEPEVLNQGKGVEVYREVDFGVFGNPQ